DGVLGGHDVDLRGVDLGQCRVERGRLTGARGAGDQHHAVRVHDRRHEVALRFRLHAELLEVERQVALVEDTEHDLLAEDHGQGRDTEVDDLVLQLELDAAVLRDAALGDVQVREDLDARGQRCLHLERRLHDLLEHAVDSVADPDLLFVWLDVDVGSAAHHGVGQDAVDELDDGRVVDLRLERGEADFFFLGLEDLDVLGLDLLEQLLEPLVRRFVVLLELLAERELARDDRLDVVPRDELEVIQRTGIRRVHHRDGERTPDATERQDAVFEGDVRRNEPDDPGVDDDLLEVDGGNAVQARDGAYQLLFRDEAELDQ